MRHRQRLLKSIQVTKMAPSSQVHKARVVAKILRSGFRFFDPNLKVYADLDKKLRRHSRSLAQFRDAEARIELSQWLKRKGLNLNLTNSRRPELSQTSATVVIQLCKIAEVSLARLTDDNRKGHVRLSRVKKATRGYRGFDPDRLHEIRKRVKEAEYQMHFFAPKNRFSKSKLRQFKQITKDLGRVRDIWLLQYPKPQLTLTREQKVRLIQMRRKLETRALDQLQKIIKTTNLKAYF